MNYLKSFESYISDNISHIINKLKEEYLANGIPCDYINKGSCDTFAEDLQHNLSQEGKESMILMDGLFFDPFDDTPKEELESTHNYGKTPLNFDGIGLPSHYWVYYNGKHYDSDTPNGVVDMFDLPTIKRFYEKHN